MGGGWSTPASGWGGPLGRRSVSYGPTGGDPGPPTSAESDIHNKAPDRHAPGPPAAAGPDVPAVPPAGAVRRRHCWVRAGDNGHGDVPGLVLDWRRGPDSTWWALTQYVVEGADGVRAILEWLPAGRLRPR